jgi:hypothetical protein
VTVDVAGRAAFLTALHDGCEGLLELRAIPSKARAFVALNDIRGLEHFLSERRAEDCYFGVATRRDATGGKLENCRHLSALFADVDFKRTPETEARVRIARLALPPSAIVHSGGGLHLYWFLREPADLPDEAERVKGLLRRLAFVVGGDLNSAEPAHVLRLPGTLNHKPEYGSPRPVTLERLDV